MGGAGMINAATTNGIEPNNICQAVSDNKSRLGERWCSFFATMTDNAQNTPDNTARNMLKVSAPKCSGSNINSIPMVDNMAAGHCKPRSFSPSIGQASTITQKGMV